MIFPPKNVKYSVPFRLSVHSKIFTPDRITYFLYRSRCPISIHDILFTMCQIGCHYCCQYQYLISPLFISIYTKTTPFFIEITTISEMNGHNRTFVSVNDKWRKSWLAPWMKTALRWAPVILPAPRSVDGAISVSRWNVVLQVLASL